jgi:protein-disulfide isomerase
MRIRKEVLVMGVILIAIIAIGFLLMRTDKTQTVDSGKIIRDDSHMTGSQGAKMTIVEFGDYQCPSCGAAHPILKQILAQYQSNPNFNFVFRNFPLPMHANALPAAEAAEAAGAQGKYWEMHDKLYENQGEWSENINALAVFANYAQQIGLDVDKFTTDIRNSKYKDFISADANDALALSLNATPTFFVNGTMQVGVPDYNALKKTIDEALAK